jgi:hypothetical protein
MNSREIIRRTLDFESPERVARSFQDSDLVSAGCQAKTQATDWIQVGSVWEHLDEWGNLWRRLDATSKGEVVRGVLDDLDQAATYRFPDFTNPEDYRSVGELRRKHPDKWLIGHLPGFAFNIARKLRRLDNYLMDIVLDRPRISALHDRIDALLEVMITNYAAEGVDAVMFPEDWGTQNQTLVSPRLWYEEFFPRFQKLGSLAHRMNLKVFMHSCGQIEAIVPGLIQAGIDLLQFDQPDLHGIDVLAAHQGNAKITFWSPVDVQKVLPTGNETLIRAKAGEMLQKLWKKRGGFIAGYYGDNVSIGLEPRWQEWACEEFLSQGI